MKKLYPAAALAAFLTAPAMATTYVRVSDEALVDGAPLIVVARVASRAAAAGGAPATDYVIRVEEVLKGSAPERLTVRVPGGGGGAVRLKIWGAPSFRPGERTMLFLRPTAHGAWSVDHLFLGAFHEVAAGERRLALRNVSGAREVRLAGDGSIAPAATPEPLRDFAAFAAWAAARARGLAAAKGYAVSGREAEELHTVVERYTLFEDPDDGLEIRWFDFDGDNPTAVHWRAHRVGQIGLSGGGYGQLQSGLQAWNDEANTPVSYDYAGTTSSTNGLQTYDGVNAILFNDPNDELSSFSCATGGVLALGGPWYEAATTTFRGVPYHRTVNADIVINNGLTCFFDSSPNASKAAEELFSHELGHTLGLGHSCGDGDGPDPSCTDATFDDALMRAFIHDDARGASLNSDDRAGLRDLYDQDASGGAPAAPTNLTATTPPLPDGLTKIDLLWTDNATNETEYRVEIRPLGGSFVDIGGASPGNSTTVTTLSAATGYEFRVRARNAAGDSAYSNVVLANTDAPIAPCVEDGDTLCLSSDRFRVEVDWRTSTGAGTGGAVPLPSSPDSGLFYFFSPSNIEVLIKVLDACTPATGNHYWVFYAATTNVELTLTVTDTQNGKTRVYFNPLDMTAAPVQDTGFFATCQ